MENCDTVPTPMVEQAKLKLDLVGKPVDHIDYHSMIGLLMYLTSSRPDIMFATCMCARYQANPNEHHVSAIKRIFQYLKGTINLGLWYLTDSGFDLTTYSDADHAGCHLDKKTKSEYVAISGCCAQVLWMRTQLTDYGFFYDKVPIYCDSQSAIAISCNPMQHTQTKHIDVRLRSEDPNQHLKDFLKLVDSVDGDNRERMRMRLFQSSLRDQASNWLERLPAGSITTWEDLTTRFLAQLFPPGRTVKLRNDILMFQHHHGESYLKHELVSRTYSKKSLIMA
ncbi:copia protein [Tanacetum coccineum]